MATVLIIGNVDHNCVNLFKSKGYEAISSPDLYTAYNDTIQHCPECVLFQIQDVADSTKFISKLKNNIYTESIPIVAACDKKCSKIRTNMFTLGVYDYIDLPATPETIVNTCTPAIELGLLQRLVTRVMNRL